MAISSRKAAVTRRGRGGGGEEKQNWTYIEARRRKSSRKWRISNCNIAAKMKMAYRYRLLCRNINSRRKAIGENNIGENM